MLEEVYIMRHGFQLPNPNVDVTDKTVLIPYIEAFDKATTIVVDTGKVIGQYNYYFEQLDAVAKMYPQYPYNKLERKYINVISQFFFIPKKRKNIHY